MSISPKLFSWSLTGWQLGLPPKDGQYLVRTEEQVKRLHVMIAHTSTDGDFALWREFDLPEETPFALPSDSQWMCDHFSPTPVLVYGSGISTAVCENCGAVGSMKTKSEILAGTSS